MKPRGWTHWRPSSCHRRVGIEWASTVARWLGPAALLHKGPHGCRCNPSPVPACSDFDFSAFSEVDCGSAASFEVRSCARSSACFEVCSWHGFAACSDPYCAVDCVVCCGVDFGFATLPAGCCSVASGFDFAPWLPLGLQDTATGVVHPRTRSAEHRSPC